jgi:tetratricopeptide (TPR) repeat protein
VSTRARPGLAIRAVAFPRTQAAAVIIAAVDHPRRKELEDLLLSMFTEDDVRRFVRYLPDGEHMHAELPGGAASLTELVHKTVSVLARHGRLDGAFFEALVAKRPARSGEIQALAARMPGPAAAGAPDEWLVSLPVPMHDRLVGREQELAQLDAAWGDASTRVLSIVAWGGAGKSTLVHHWLEGMRQDGWWGARKIYGWSFYAQGTQDTSASSEAFFAAALDFFGDAAAAHSAPQTRVRRLVTLIRQQPTLLVLDGLEPLQEPPHGVHPGGKVRDPSLGELLRALAQRMNGLCLITSRLAVKDLAAQARDAAPVLALDRLRTADGATFLRDLGVHGSEAELRAAADEQDGHALALMLLGKYLHAVRGGDVTRRHDISMLAAAEVVHSGKLERIMAAYDAWLEPRPRAVMRLVGLFDRPADDAALAALRRTPAIPGLTEALVDAGGDDWRVALRPLREVGLLAPESPQQPGALDAHPLVRAYFGARLRREQPEAWRAAHARLYEHYLTGAPEVAWDVAGLGRLVDAVIHGCHAGRHVEVYRDVYRSRIHRKRYDATVHLGAFGMDLTALAGFFERRWDRPLAALDPAAQARVLGAVGFDLQALGRLRDALVPLQAALALDRAADRRQPAAAIAADLASTYLLLGSVSGALVYARYALDLANQSGEGVERVARRTNLAEVLHHAGKIEESAALFAEAEQLQAQRQRSYPQLYALHGARYCALLLDLAAPLDGTALGLHALPGLRLAETRQLCLDVRRRAEITPGWAESRGSTPLSRGLDRLSLGRAHLGLWLAERARGTPAEAPDVVVHRNQAAAALDVAVDELRQSGRDDTLPRALLARAGLRRFLDDRAGAEIELAEIDELAERSGMRLLGCDAHLERARLALAGGHDAAARAHTGAARAIVTETGYHRRDRELAALDAALSRTH